MDWESVKVFVAVAREGSLAAAGRVLGVRHSTVLRRVAALEEDLGLKLFERHPAGYQLTPAGREMLDQALRIDEDMVSLERRLSGRDLRLTGLVRIATLGPLVPWLAPALAEFRGLHPGITLEVAISPALASLARLEADIALRVSGDPPQSLVGRRVATLVHGVYAAAFHPAARAGMGDPGGQDWVAYGDSRSDLPLARWVAARVPNERVVLRSNHTGMLLAAVKAGMGLGLLPCYLGDTEAGLVRLDTVAGLGQEMWLLTHHDLRRTPRIRVTLDFLAKALIRRRDLIEGRGGERAE